MPTFLKAIVKGIGKFLLALAVLFGLYLVVLAWETRKVSSFCSDLHPGMQVSSIPTHAAKRGIDQRWLQAIEDKKQSDWFFYVPIGATMGDMGCAVHHDGNVITGIRMHSLFE